MKTINNVCDSNVDVVVICHGHGVIGGYKGIDFYPSYKCVKKMSLEDQVLWNSIYNDIVDKDSEGGHMLVHNESVK